VGGTVRYEGRKKKQEGKEPNGVEKRSIQSQGHGPNDKNFHSTLSCGRGRNGREKDIPGGKAYQRKVSKGENRKSLHVIAI